MIIDKAYGAIQNVII